MRLQGLERGRQAQDGDHGDHRDYSLTNTTRHSVTALETNGHRTNN